MVAVAVGVKAGEEIVHWVFSESTLHSPLSVLLRIFCFITENINFLLRMINFLIPSNLILLPILHISVHVSVLQMFDQARGVVTHQRKPALVTGTSVVQLYKIIPHRYRRGWG